MSTERRLCIRIEVVKLQPTQGVRISDHIIIFSIEDHPRAYPPLDKSSEQTSRFFRGLVLKVPTIVCGVLGLLLHNPEEDAASEICEGLSLLQHRGQDACGIITCGARGKFYQCKANGMVRDVFDQKSLSTLTGGMGVGHGKLMIKSRSRTPTRANVMTTYSQISHCRLISIL